MSLVLDDRSVASDRAARLELLAGFSLSVGGRPVAVPLGIQRLLALLALRRRPQQRTAIAGILWLDETEHRARANLRTALWRVKETGFSLLDVTPDFLGLSNQVNVDLAESSEMAKRIVRGEAIGNEPPPEDLLCSELLPDWYDDWVLIEREQHRQLRLHALEELSGQLLRAGKFARAIHVALDAVAAEPLRESAHRRVIEVHLAEGNRCEAMRQYQTYWNLADTHLGCEPSQSLRGLVVGT